LESFFREGAGVEDGLNRGRRRGREDFGGECGVPYVVESEAGAVEGVVSALIRDGIQMPGGNAGLEDQVLVGFGDAVAVVDDDEGSVAAGPQGRGDVDVTGAGVAGVAQELEEGVLDGAEVTGAAPETLGAGQAGEAAAQVAVRAFHALGVPSSPVSYRAYSVARLSRMTVTRIWPGYSSSSSICLEMSKASLAAMRSSTTEGWTMTRISRPAWMA
jgi:hypothetical protein